MQTEDIKDLQTALAKAQGTMSSVPFDRINPHFKSKYSSLAAVIDTIRKPLADNGLSYTQTTEIRDGNLVLVTTLRHASGQWVASEYPLPNAAKPQELGSALTYARRYSLSSIACIAADDDDDAEVAHTNGQKNAAPPAKPQPVQPPIDPATGEVGPHKITAPDVMTWGSSFVAAIKASTTDAEIDQWEALNKEGRDMLPEKIAARVDANVAEKRAALKKKAA